MPKAAPYRVTWNPARRSYVLSDRRSVQELPVVPDGREWFEWLAHVPSFTFSRQHGHLTVRQESRPGGGVYW